MCGFADADMFLPVLHCVDAILDLLEIIGHALGHQGARHKLLQPRVLVRQRGSSPTAICAVGTVDAVLCRLRSAHVAASSTVHASVSLCGAPQRLTPEADQGVASVKLLALDAETDTNSGRQIRCSCRLTDRGGATQLPRSSPGS